MRNITPTTIDWDSQKLLTQIAHQIHKPLGEIIRLIQHIQTKTEKTDHETKRLSSIMLESSEQIETLIEDILRIEQNKRIEILIHDKFRYPDLYVIRHNHLNSSNNLMHTLSEGAENRISKADLDWLIQLESTILANIDFYGLSVSWLADQLAVSERHIFRKIEKFTQLTPNKYIRSIRLHKAKELLESYTFSTVNEVACAVGLRDPYYFSSLYKEEFGVKPKDYLV